MNAMIVCDHLDSVLPGREGQIVPVDSNGQIWQRRYVCAAAYDLEGSNAPGVCHSRESLHGEPRSSGVPSSRIFPGYCACQH